MHASRHRRLAWHGGLGPHAADARGARLRSHRADVLLDVERRRQGSGHRPRHAAAAGRERRRARSPRRTRSSPARAATARTRCTRSCARPAGTATGSMPRQTLRMKDDAVIILDPVNRAVIDAALAQGVRNYIGGNCTVSLMMMALAGLFAARPHRVDDVHDLPGGVGRRRAEHARAAAADGRGAPRGARACSRIRTRRSSTSTARSRASCATSASRPSTSACRSPAASFRGSTRTWATA